MKRAQTRRQLTRALRDTFPQQEEWQRHDHWWGVEYRHAAVDGRRWRVMAGPIVLSDPWEWGSLVLALIVALMVTVLAFVGLLYVAGMLP